MNSRRGGGRSAGSELLRSTHADIAGAGGEDEFAREGEQIQKITRPEAPKLLDVPSCFAILHQNRVAKKLHESSNIRNRKREREVDVERYSDRMRMRNAKKNRDEKDFFGGGQKHMKLYFPAELLRGGGGKRYQNNKEDHDRDHHPLLSDGDSDGEVDSEDEDEENNAESDQDGDYEVNHYEDDDDFGDDARGGGGDEPSY